MRAVLQRVASAHVEVDGKRVGEIGRGLLILLGVEQGDGAEDVRYLAEKSAQLRIFEDAAGKMNLSLADVGGQALVVSQFTLLADCRKGRRPGFSRAALPEPADLLYQQFVTLLRERGLTVATGIFQAEMQVHLVNDGPVTLLLDSRKEF
ncbi:D-aminoacyl-tRNA deacylase [Trichloromonas sp.]|uniref:D-aminoacyl-tRNA deacylase n=1 Tax=Trichloromonas sp. TaxID=3069249 RepID=UPI002A3A2422|nr:D-aminoacyl-tRNA deacylase [Trichloromonas sp.]